jgi:hypothetical protein
MFSLRLNCALSSAKLITKAHASHNTLKNICSFYFHACRLEYSGAKILLLFTPFLFPRFLVAVAVDFKFF